MLRSERRKQLRYKRKAEAIQLLGSECVNCGSTKRLEFDHVKNDREDEGHMISRMLENDWEKLLEELKKCQLLCVSCHRIKTGNDVRPLDFDIVKEYPAQNDGHGTHSMYVSHKCRCKHCRAANSVYSRKYMRKNIEKYRAAHVEYARKYRLERVTI